VFYDEYIEANEEVSKVKFLTVLSNMVDRGFSEIKSKMAQGTSFESYHQESLRLANNLARVYVKNKNFSKATVLYSQYMNFCSKIFGPDHPSTLNVIFDINR